MPLPNDDRVRRLESRLERERRARAEAEQLLEAKSHELYDANQALGRLAADLEQRVAERTHQLSEARHHALRQAETDSLTGIANRAAFLRRLDATLASGDALHSGVAVLLIDLDDFKTVNDTLGHAAGDRLLIDVARRLGEACRPGDVVGRLGGDEFAVLAVGVGAGDARLNLAQRLLHSVNRPVEVDGKLVPCGCSIGLSEATPAGLASDELLANADMALYAAKRAGRARVTQFQPALRADIERRAELEREVHDAVMRHRIEPWFQPIHCHQGTRFCGAEVLARWNTGDGVRAPAEFLGVVESLGLLDLMMDNMLRVALREAAPCVRNGQLDYLSVNVSPPQFSEGWPLKLLPGLLRDTGFPAGALVVEITETALLQDMDRSRSTLAALDELGIRVAIDDFGVGFSNFSVLRQLHFHILKLDRSLVCDIDRDEDAHVIVRCLLDMAARLRIDSVAEGVERPEQAALLVASGCNALQGWHFARPQRSIETWFPVPASPALA
jgi:diguanylate cyclase (GGDEF)-like protein